MLFTGNLLVFGNYWTQLKLCCLAGAVYTIYFHLEYIVLTASEKDSMATSYLTLNTISTKPVLSIAACLISLDYCSLYFTYYTHYSGLYSTTASQRNIHYSTTDIHHPSPPYRIYELCVPCHCLVFTLHDIIVPIILCVYFYAPFVHVRTVWFLYSVPNVLCLCLFMWQCAIVTLNERLLDFTWATVEKV